jgi:DNA-binding HxlR family transcriptional regulator
METAPRAAAECAELCPDLARTALDVLGSKWAVPVIVGLQTSSTPIRYADLRRRIGAITAKELTKQLRSLESIGVLGRRVYPTVPPQVEYWLTEFGDTLLPAVWALADLGAQFAAVNK